MSGISWDEETLTLTLDQCQMPETELSIGGSSRTDWINVELKGENTFQRINDLACTKIYGDGVLNLGWFLSNNLDMYSGTLNFNSDLVHATKDEPVGIAMYAKQWYLDELETTETRFLGGTVNISGYYRNGIETNHGNLVIADAKINIDLPELGEVGLGCGMPGDDGKYHAGRLTVLDSDIRIRVKQNGGIPLFFGEYIDANQNLYYYTGRNQSENRITFEEAFKLNSYLGARRWERNTKDFKGQNYFRITDMKLFGDVADSSRYFYEPVYWAFNHDPQITTGTNARLFSPDQNVTRGQMVTFLYRLAGQPEVKGAKSFDDVDPDRYYAKAISWAASEGITTGYYGTNSFGPDDFCTREQIVTFLWRYAETPAPVNPASFTDAKAGAYYLDALSWAAENRITVGLNDGTGRFGVGHTCTRGMCVTFLYRYDSLKK